MEFIRFIVFFINNNIPIFFGIICVLLAALIAHRFAISREKKIPPLKVSYFDVKELGLGIAELNLSLNIDEKFSRFFKLFRKKENPICATIKIDVIKSWDFLSGEITDSLDPVTPSSSNVCLLISPNTNASIIKDIIFYNTEKISLCLYTDHVITDNFIVCVGLTLFQLKITVSSPRFEDYTTSVIVQLTGGTHKTTFARGITKTKFTEQKKAAQKIMKMVKNGAYIDQNLELQLKSYCD
jgi:hypothetical protein